MTPRLYFDDPRGAPFEATVKSLDDWQGTPALVLDQTGFYPESGGQMGDRGRLGGLTVNDVQVGDDGIVKHLVDLSGFDGLPAELSPGSRVEGRPDLQRRRLFRALHTGQHILSRSLIEVAGAETLSSRLGESLCTIDTDKVALSEAELAAIEGLANDVVDDDLPVAAFFPPREVLDRLPLRRAPKVKDNIRIVQVGTFDLSPCGGTHCTATSQVGLIRLLGIERYKGGLRLRFDCGARARRVVFEAQETLLALSRSLTCGPPDVARTLERLKVELQGARDSQGRLRAQLAESVAASLLAQSGPEPRFVLRLDGFDLEYLRAVGKRLIAAPGAVVLLACSEGESTRLFVARGHSASFDCGLFVKAAVARFGGRGGGRPESAEGLLPGLVELSSLLDESAP